jgi:hypothetical protein
VAETNARPRPGESKGIRNWITGRVMRSAGAALDGGGALLVAGEVGNTIWRVTAGS